MIYNGQGKQNGSYPTLQAVLIHMYKFIIILIPSLCFTDQFCQFPRFFLGRKAFKVPERLMYCFLQHSWWADTPAMTHTHTFRITSSSAHTPWCLAIAGHSLLCYVNLSDFLSIAVPVCVELLRHTSLIFVILYFLYAFLNNLPPLQASHERNFPCESCRMV